MTKQKKKKASVSIFTKYIEWICPVVVFFLYLSSLSFGFVLDDDIVINGNAFVKQGFGGWSDILSHDTFAGFFGSDKSDLVAGGRYRPFTLLLFSGIYQFFGDAPWVYHFLNIVCYAFLVWLIFKVLNTLLGEKLLVVSFLTTAIFAVHPTHVEVVANSKGLDEVLALLFGLLSLVGVLRYLERKQVSWLLMACVSLFLGLLSKENAITFLFITPLAVWFFRPAFKNQLIKIGAFLLAPTLLFLAIRYAVLGDSIGGQPMELMNNPFIKIENGQYIAMSFVERMGMISYCFFEYLRLLFFPFQLSHDYYPMVVPQGWVAKGFIGLVAALGLVGFTVWSAIQKKPYTFGLLLFFASFFLVSNLLFPIGTNMAERFLFMPSLGFALAAMLLIKEKLQQKPVLIVVYAFLFFFIGRSLFRIPVWESNKTLFLTDVKTVPNSAKLNNAAGGTYLEEAATLTDQTKIYSVSEIAASHLKKAIKLHPNYKNAHLLLGNAYTYQQKYEEGIASFDRVLKLNPGDENGIKNKAIALRQLGRQKGEKENNLPDALKYLNESLNLNPNDAETLRLLGVAVGVSGDNQKALSYFERAVKVGDTNAAAWRDYSVALNMVGRAEEANSAAAKARSLNPDIFNQR